MPRYDKKVDQNQSEVVEEIRKALSGSSVFVASGTGDGFTDLVIGWKGMNFLIEVKDPSKPPSGRKLTPAQVKFHDSWQGQVDVCHSAAEAIAVVAREAMNRSTFNPSIQ